MKYTMELSPEEEPSWILLPTLSDGSLVLSIGSKMTLLELSGGEDRAGSGVPQAARHKSSSTPRRMAPPFWGFITKGIPQLSFSGPEEQQSVVGVFVRSLAIMFIPLPLPKSEVSSGFTV